MSITRVGVALLISLIAPLGISAQGAPTPEQRVAALKQSLQDSQAQLRKFEWVETTIISLKGEEKARTHKRAYYGADGKLQKIVMDDAPKPAAAPAGGRRGGRVKAKVIENKKNDMQEYMERAAALIHQYVPPAPAQVQKVKDAGKLTVKPIDAARVRLELKDYLQAGDTLAIDVDAAASALAALSVATYLDKPEDTVALAVRWGTLQDGTGYVAQTTLDAKAKNIQVVIQNTGHRPLTK